MKYEFRGNAPIFFKEAPLGQVFRYGKEMFLAIAEIWDEELGKNINAVSLEDGIPVVFDSFDEITPCRLVGYFEPALLGE